MQFIRNTRRKFIKYLAFLSAAVFSSKLYGKGRSEDSGDAPDHPIDSSKNELNIQNLDDLENFEPKEGWIIAGSSGYK